MLFGNMLKFICGFSLVAAHLDSEIHDERAKLVYKNIVELIKPRVNIIYSNCKENLSREVLNRRKLALNKKHIYVRIHGYTYSIKVADIFLKSIDLYNTFKNCLHKTLAQPLYSAHFALFCDESTSLLVKDSPRDFLIAFGNFFDYFLQGVLRYCIYSDSQLIDYTNLGMEILYEVLKSMSIKKDIQMICEGDINWHDGDVFKRIEALFDQKLKSFEKEFS